MRTGLTDVEIEALAARVRRHPEYGPPVGAEDLARRVLDDLPKLPMP